MMGIPRTKNWVIQQIFETGGCYVFCFIAYLYLIDDNNIVELIIENSCKFKS
jgi:hypothetical protein